MGCGAETEANALLTALLEGTNFAVPTLDLNTPDFEIPVVGDIGEPVTKLTNADLTTGTVSGSGTFDTLMKGFNSHLKEEFDKGRITGEQYSKAYIELTVAAMGNAVQYLLGRDSSYWQAITAQLQAQAAQVAVVNARVLLEVAKVQFQSVRAEALTNQANYGLTKMKISSESLAYCVAKFQLDEMMPVQKQMLMEQYEAQRAQTLNTRSDGVTPVAGQVGKQVALYDQQITSYKRDAEVKTAKLFTDAWITMKTMDEGLLPPTEFTNVSLNEILTKLKEVNNLVDVP